MSASKSLQVVVRKRSGRRLLTASVDAYDALTLVWEECDALSVHLAERLAELAAEGDRSSELSALTLVAKHLREKQQQIGRHADALLEQVRVSTAGA